MITKKGASDHECTTRPPIWSLAFRRRERNPADQVLVDELTELIRETRIVMIGPIRQEVLSGIAHIAQFNIANLF